MVDYERTMTVAATPDEAFGALTDPGNLTRYIATMVSAEGWTQAGSGSLPRLRAAMKRAMPVSVLIRPTDG